MRRSHEIVLHSRLLTVLYHRGKIKELLTDLAAGFVAFSYTLLILHFHHNSKEMFYLFYCIFVIFFNLKMQQ